jgi:hypothetical protein
VTRWGRSSDLADVVAQARIVRWTTWSYRRTIDRVRAVFSGASLLMAATVAAAQTTKVVDPTEQRPSHIDVESDGRVVVRVLINVDGRINTAGVTGRLA